MTIHRISICMFERKKIMKLELKHLAPYLPYGLKIYVYGQTRFENYTCEIEGLDKGGQVYFSHEWNNIYNSEYFKPLLRPLSDFDKLDNDFDLTTDFETVYQITSGDICFVNTSDKSYLSDFIIVNKFMFEHHFDVFGLIPAGLAIDINTIDKKTP